MSSTEMKYIALLTMLIDHVGSVFFPELYVLRIIGRVSFPLYCFLLSEGFNHTKSVRNYLLRIFIFAVISEIPFDMLFYKIVFNPNEQNVLFELSLGIIALIFCRMGETKNKLFYLLTVIPVIAAVLLRTSYGAYGIILILSFWLCKNNRFGKIVSVIVITCLFYGLFNYQLVILNNRYDIFVTNILQQYAILSVVFFLSYNGELGRRSNKWLFYAFYPLHMFVLYLISAIIT
jgi:hypothetical protein